VLKFDSNQLKEIGTRGGGSGRAIKQRRLFFPFLQVIPYERTTSASIQQSPPSPSKG
jgi:hypothetical protein